MRVPMSVDWETPAVGVTCPLLVDVGAAELEGVPGVAEVPGVAGAFGPLIRRLRAESIDRSIALRHERIR